MTTPFAPLPTRSDRPGHSRAGAARRHLRRSTLLLAAALAGCGDGAVDPGIQEPGAPPIAAALPACQGPATSLSATLAAQLRSGGFRTVDDVFADLSRQVPGGFAGVVYDRPSNAWRGTRPTTGGPVLLLTNPSQAAAAKSALAPALPHFDVAGAEVRPARWTFAQLYDWYRYLGQQSIWSGSNVTMSDIDEVNNRIEVGVRDEQARTTLKAQLSSMGLPCDLVHVLIVPAAETRPAR
jgi:hypothetical protein